MKRLIATVLTAIIPAVTILGSAAVLGTSPAFAAEESDEVPRSFETIEYETVDRVEIVRMFLDKYNSPLAAHAETFVEVADEIGLDYRVMPAISGVESTFAKYYIPYTHNPFGWGGGLIAFDSFDSAIKGLGKGLQEIYISRGLDTVEEIAPVYCPPSSQSWTSKVNYFKNQMPQI